MEISSSQKWRFHGFIWDDSWILLDNSWEILAWFFGENFSWNIFDQPDQGRWSSLVKWFKWKCTSKTATKNRRNTIVSQCMLNMASNLAWQCWKIQLTVETVTSGMKNHEFRRGLSQILGLTTWSSAAFSNTGTYHQLAGAHAARQQSIMPHGVEHYHALQGRFLWDLIGPYELGGNSVGTRWMVIFRLWWATYLKGGEKCLDILHYFTFASSFILGETVQLYKCIKGKLIHVWYLKCVEPLGYEIMEFNLQKRLLLPKLRADNYPPEPPLIIAM